MALLQFILYLTQQSRLMQHLEKPTSLIWVYFGFLFLISPALLGVLKLHMLSVKTYSHFLFFVIKLLAKKLQMTNLVLGTLYHVPQITGYIYPLLLYPSSSCPQASVEASWTIATTRNSNYGSNLDNKQNRVISNLSQVISILLVVVSPFLLL